LTKNVGVPDTPLASAESTSSAILSGPAAQVLPEGRHVQAQAGRVPHQVGRPQLALMTHQAVVHRPERALRCSGLRGLRRQLGPRVDVTERKVPPHEPDVIMACQQFGDRPLGQAAVRALEIAILHHGHAGVPPPPNVVTARIHRRIQVDDGVGRPGQGPRPRLGRQQPRQAERGPRGQRGRQGSSQNPGLGLGELFTAEGKRRDQQRDREPDAGYRTARIPPAAASQAGRRPRL
jgi:hypothetical protein